MEKGVWPSRSEISRMGALGEFLNMADFSSKKGAGGLTDKPLIIDKDGSLKTPNEYGQISPDQNSYRLEKLPYFLRISKLRAIIYVSEGICTLKTYKIWRNLLYEAGYAATLISGSNRHLDIHGLETVGRYFWGVVFGKSSQKNISAQNATESCLNDPRLMVELLPDTVSLSRPGPSGSDEPDTNKRRQNPKVPDKDPKKGEAEKDVDWREYFTNGETVLKPYHPWGYRKIHRGTDPNSKCRKELRIK